MTKHKIVFLFPILLIGALSTYLLTNNLNQVSAKNVVTPKNQVTETVKPPADFDLLKASPEELQKYHFPPKPNDEKALAGWTYAMEHAKHYVDPVIIDGTEPVGVPAVH